MIAFIVAGDPDEETTRSAADAIIAGGADILELGLPYSDPVADGPTIQAASQRALDAGMTPDRYFALAKAISTNHPDTPLVTLTYYNLVLQRGLERFASDMEASGIDGLICPDVPLEEASALLTALRKSKRDLILLATPTSPPERLAKITKKAQGFIYAVSLRGVTGQRTAVTQGLSTYLDRISEAHPTAPIAVGFGISTPEQVRAVLHAGADAAIVGSGYVSLIEKSTNSQEAYDAVRELTRRLRDATKGPV